MKIYVLSTQEYDASENVCVSENIQDIRKSICEDLEQGFDYPELSIWENGELKYHTTGQEVLKKIAEEINLDNDSSNLTSGKEVSGNTEHLQGISLPIMVNTIWNSENQCAPSPVCEMHIGKVNGESVVLITPEVISLPEEDNEEDIDLL